jgi:hypothetical protein
MVARVTLVVASDLTISAASPGAGERRVEMNT